MFFLRQDSFSQSDNSSANNQDIHVPRKSTNIEQPIWRSNRYIIKPVRFRDENFITNEKKIEDSLSTDSRSEKVKRILAKKKHGNSFLYLVQYRFYDITIRSPYRLFNVCTFFRYMDILIICT
jgi:hypothetical protein